MLIPNSRYTWLTFSLLLVGLCCSAYFRLPVLAAPPEPAPATIVNVHADGTLWVQPNSAPPPPAPFAPVRDRRRTAETAAMPTVGTDLCTPNTVVGLPTLLSPADGAATTSLIPTLAWLHDVNDSRVVYYNVQLATTSTFSSLIESVWYSVGSRPPNQPLTNLYFNNLLPNTLYYWRVVNYCGTVQSNAPGGTSVIRSFHTGANGTILPAPTQTTPADGATVATSLVAVGYSPVADATEYQVRFYRTPGTWENSSRFSTYFLSGTAVNATFTAGETIYWRVAARNAYGWGEPSVQRAFTLVAPTPFTDCTAVTGITQSECEALVALYNGTVGPSWYNRSGWLATDLPCTWYGITCTNGHVTHIRLWSNNLGGFPPSAATARGQSLQAVITPGGGSLPAELGNLPYLQELSLQDNRISGALPAQLGNLSALQLLALWGNQLSGPLAVELGNLTNLQKLWLSNNQFSGAIPLQLGSLTQLQELTLAQNQLSGALPVQLGNLAALLVLDLSGNQLSGAIPTELGNLTNLQSLWMSDNQFSGTLPTQLGNLTQLRDISLWNNQLTGSLPTTFGKLVNLQGLAITNNQLSGVIPPQLGNLLSLQRLYLWGNQLTGPIPPELGNLTNLQELWLGYNRLSGAIPAQLGNLAQLQTLALESNQLAGPLPATLGQLTNLQRLVLQDNPGLIGPLPLSLTNLTQLWELNFQQTSLCEPTDLDFQAWLRHFEVLRSTGVLCEATIQVRKKADLPRSAPNTANGYTLVMRNPGLAPATVTAIQDTLPFTFTYLPGSTSGATTANPMIAGQTLTWSGAFVIQPSQEITLHFGVQLPGDQPQGIYYNSATVDATDAEGNVIVVQPAANVAPIEVPPPTVATNPGVTVPTGSTRTDPTTGEVNVAMPRGNRSDLTITSAIACPVPPGGLPTSVILHHGSYNTAMTETPSGSGVYVATIPAAAVISGPVDIAVTCLGTVIANAVAEVRLYDPSGLISDAVTGAPLQDVKVTLYRVPGWRPDTATETRECRTVDTRGAGGWSQAAPTQLGVPADAALQPAEIDPALNPQYTNVEGRYGWNVVEGCWYVTVEKAGYVTKISPVVGVPPEVTDLDLALMPLNTTVQVTLSSGWNLIALPVIPTTTTPAAVFANIAGSYNLAYAYDGCVAGNPWQKYNPGGPPFANTLATVNVTQGLWVRATSAVTLTVTGADPANMSIPLCAGWNLITYSGNAPTPIATALASIAGQYNLVYAYNAANAGNPWQKYNPSGPPFANTLTELKPGVGYWIRVTTATTLVVP